MACSDINTQTARHTLNQSDTSISSLYAVISEQIKKTNSIKINLEKLKDETSTKLPSMDMIETPSTDSVYNDDDNIQFIQLLHNLCDIDEDLIFADNGYKKLDKICNTLQGEMFKAKKLSNNKVVAIKKTDKSLFKQKIAIQDDISFCVEENIIKESLILKYLTSDNQCMGDYIVKFIEFFESDTDYYLVMEYIESNINLKELVYTSHQYIKNGKLKLKHYQKIIKYIYWQIAVTIHWLHNDMKCCHLDLCLENIMLTDCNFIKQKDGFLMIDPKISIKLGDFGVSEVFGMEEYKESFDCRKQGLSIENELYLAPQIYEDELYDARSADIWSLGMILYQCLTGKPLYEPMEIWESSSSDVSINGHSALHQKQLAQYIESNNLSKYFRSSSFDLLINLLNINENERFNAMNVLKHKWFESYYKTYSQRIENKSILQKQKLLRQEAKMQMFPYYELIQY